MIKHLNIATIVAASALATLSGAQGNWYLAAIWAVCVVFEWLALDSQIKVEKAHARVDALVRFASARPSADS